MKIEPINIPENKDLTIELLESEIDRLKEELEKQKSEIISLIEKFSKRSHYEWSSGPQYEIYEFLNEGKIELANYLLNVLR